MKKSLLVLNSVVGAAVLTAVVAAGTLLYLMFSTGDEVVHKTGLFGVLFFTTSRLSGGGLGVDMGVADTTRLLVMVLALTLLLAWIQLVFGGLKNYRAGLLEHGRQP